MEKWMEDIIDALTELKQSLLASDMPKYAHTVNLVITNLTQESNRLEKLVMQGSSSADAKSEPTCENCKSNQDNGSKLLNHCFCQKHGRFIGSFYDQDKYTLKDVGCKQFEPK